MVYGDHEKQLAAKEQQKQDQPKSESK